MLIHANEYPLLIIDNAYFGGVLFFDGIIT